MRNIFLEQIRVVKYCGYEDSTFKFVREDGTPYPFVCFYGPNGVGKTSLLEAIMLLSLNTSGRPKYTIQEYLRKYVKNTDYEPGYEGLKGKTYSDGYISGDKSPVDQMMIEGVYRLEGKKYIVQLTQNGFIRNDFAPIPPNDMDADEAIEFSNSGPFGKNHLKYRQRINHILSSDTDISLSKFQLHASQMEKFEKIVAEITRFPADCIAPSGTSENDKMYCLDFVITKRCSKTNQDQKIHFKQMSAGERRIIKSFSELLNIMDDLENPLRGESPMPGFPRILLIDEVEQHVYWDRHITLVECLKKVFNNQQIFATSHSGILIPRQLRKENDYKNELWIDLEKENY